MLRTSSRTNFNIVSKFLHQVEGGNPFFAIFTARVDPYFFVGRVVDALVRYRESPSGSELYCNASCVLAACNAAYFFDPALQVYK